MTLLHLGKQIQMLAGELDAPEIAAAVKAVMKRLDEERGVALILGEPGVGRCSFVQTVMDIENVLPVSAVLKGHVGIRITPGESTAMSLVTGAGKAIRLGPEDLSPILTGSSYRHGAVRVTLAPDLARAVRGTDIDIESLPEHADRAAWLTRLANVDAIFVVISAMQALTAREQELLQSLSDLELGTGHVTLVVTKCDQLDHENLQQVLQRVRHLVGMDSGISTVAFSSADPGSYASELAQLRLNMTAAVEARYSLATSLLRAATDELVEIADLRLSHLALLAATRRAGALSGAERARMLQRRISYVQEWIDTEVGVRLLEQALQKTRKFAEVFRAALPQEISVVNDAALLKRHGTAYLTSTWEDFAEHTCREMEPDIEVIVQRLNAAIVKDLADLLDDQLDVDKSIESLTPYSPQTAVFLPRRTRTVGRTVAAIGSTAGAVMLLTASFPLGLLVLGTSIGLRQLTAPSHADRTLQEVTHALHAANEELEDDWVTALQQSFNDLVVALSEDTARIYTTALAGLNEQAAEQFREEDRTQARTARYTQLRDTTLPALMEEIQSLIADTE